MGVTVAEMKEDTYHLGLLCANFWGTWKGGSFTRDFERWMKEGSGNGVSLSVEAL
jgi:hypothetical protein